MTRMERLQHTGVLQRDCRVGQSDTLEPCQQTHWSASPRASAIYTLFHQRLNTLRHAVFKTEMNTQTKLLLSHCSAGVRSKAGPRILTSLGLNDPQGARESRCSVDHASVSAALTCRDLPRIVGPLHCVAQKHQRRARTFPRRLRAHENSEARADSQQFLRPGNEVSRWSRVVNRCLEGWSGHAVSGRQSAPGLG